MKVSAYSLLEKTKDGGITGPMSPVLFAKEMAQQMNIKVAGLARINFENQEVLQIYEGRGKTELTGYDHLAILQKWPNDAQIIFMIDMGVGGLPVAMRFRNKSENLIITPVYENTEFAIKPLKDTLVNLFHYLFDNEDKIFAIKPYVGPEPYRKLTNQEILAKRTAAYDKKPGPRVGDYLKTPDGKYTRFTHKWDDHIQTGGSPFGSYYLGKGGYMEYSGGLDSGLKLSDLVETEETKLGTIWFFKEDHARAHNGINFEITHRVFVPTEGADLSGVYTYKPAN